MNKPNIIGIYKITSPAGRIYIGQSRNCTKRQRKYKCLDCKKQTRLYHSIMKYGWDQHTFQVIHDCEIHQLNYLENFYIEQFDSFDTDNGLNLIKGNAANGSRSKETRLKNREATKLCYANGKKERPIGNKNGMYGNGHKLAGSKNGRYGMAVSEKTREKIREGNIINYKINGTRKHPENEKLHLAKLRMAKNGKDGLSSGKFYGVYLPVVGKKYYCYMRLKGKRAYIGKFVSEIEAATAVNEFQMKHFGEIRFYNNVA